MQTMYKVSTKHLSLTPIKCLKVTDYDIVLPSGSRIKLAAKHSQYFKNSEDAKEFLLQAMQDAQGDELYAITQKYRAMGKALEHQVNTLKNDIPKL